MELVVHVQAEYDYRFICPTREELFASLKECYFRVMNDNLPIYGVPDKLKEYSTSKKDIKKGNVRKPPDSFRLKNEDSYEPEIIKTTSSSNEELDLKMIDPED